MTEDEMIGWHHRLNGHEIEKALGVGDGQGRLACCSPWGHKESNTTEQLNWTEVIFHRKEEQETGKRNKRRKGWRRNEKT